MARRKARAAVVHVREVNDLGTDETRQNRVVNAVVAMVANGKLDAVCVMASQEIAAAYRLSTERLWWKTAHYGERMSASTCQAVGDEDAQAVRRVDRAAVYRAWTDRAVQRQTVGVAGACVRDLVLDAAVFDCGLRQIAEARRMDQRTVELRLAASLADYCGLRGWPVASLADAA